MQWLPLTLSLGLALGACAAPPAAVEAPAPSLASTPSAPAAYFDNAGRTDVLAGGVRRIPITTRKGTFTVWTKRVDNNPTLEVLLLHGGPGATHEAFEAFDCYFPAAGGEAYGTTADQKPVSADSKPSPKIPPRSKAPRSTSAPTTRGA